MPSLMVAIGDHSIMLYFYKDKLGLYPFDVETRIFPINLVNTMAA